MATSFRYGANGSYKSACAVWFDLLPNLRAGRVCVTNVEGMQPLDVIQKRLGEKFPDSTRLIRISSRNQDGIFLWQNWFCWMPIGAFVLIDECQDLFGKHVGFKMEKQQWKPFDEFADKLPSNFSELFYSSWKPVDLSVIDAGELDDTGRTQYDEQGRLLYPFEFNGAFMRHRKYNWDIVLLTPDWKQIPSEIKGCAELAKGHVNKDCFFSKRKPRIFEHHPTASASKPTKEDLVYRQKVPVDVHLLYSSTGTGQVTKSGMASALFKQPKLYISFIIFLACVGYFVYALSSVLSDSSESDKKNVESNQVSHSSSSNTKNGNTQDSSVSGGVDSAAVSNDDSKKSSGFVSSVATFFPFINDAKSAYITALNVSRVDGHTNLDLMFKVIGPSGRYYVPNSTLVSLGTEVKILDECLVELKHDNQSVYVSCPPILDVAQVDDVDVKENVSENKTKLSLL
ncbi:TPA: zonular occludens toxin domain-containing protein [Photobacterium damselae]